MTERLDYYAELGLSRGAPPEDIRRAYHRAARLLHPDTNKSSGAAEAFLQVQAAFEVLSDPQKRAAYDRKLPPAGPEAPAADLIITYSRPYLLRISDPQLIYILLDLHIPPGAKLRPSPPVNLCLVIDRSTSMQGERMDSIKSTAIQLLKHMRSPDLFSIVTFSDRAEVLLPPTEVTNRLDIEASIKMIQTGGGTEIFRGLETALLEIRSKYSSDYINHIILLTDGRTYGDEANCLALAGKAADLGIGISGLGIGDAWNDTFLDSLASITGGTSLYISRIGDIKRFLTDKIKGLGLVYADRVSLEMQCHPLVELTRAFRLSPDAQPLQAAPPLRLGAILKEPPLSVLLELKIQPLPASAQEHTLIDGDISMEIPTLYHSLKRVPIKITLPVVAGKHITPPPTQILEALSRLNLYRMQENAQLLMLEGQPDKARQSLQNLATQLSSQGQADLAREALREIANIDSNLGISEAGKKRIKYGTRALLMHGYLPPGSTDE